MKKLFVLFVTLQMLCFFLCGVSAEETEQDDLEMIREVVTDFMTRYTMNMFMYESNELKTGTTATLADDVRSQISLAMADMSGFRETPYTDDQSVKLDDMDYVFEKAEYFKYIRQRQDIYREDFEIVYSFDSILTDVNYAQVILTEALGFYYAGSETPSMLAQSHEIYLVKDNGVWLIFNITTDDGFDSITQGTEFSASVEIQQFENGYMASDSSSSTPDFHITPIAPDTEVSPMTPMTEVSPMMVCLVNTIRPYNRENAIRYAHTYVYHNATGSGFYPAYYNGNF